MNATVKLLFLTDRLNLRLPITRKCDDREEKNQKSQKSLNSHFTINDFSDS